MRYTFEFYALKGDNKIMRRVKRSFSFFPSPFSSQTGQTLIETLSALAIIGMVITAIGIVVTTSLSNSTFDENETLATKYAQQGAEIVQQIRDDDYAAFQTYSTNGTQYYCLGKGKTTLGAVKSSCTAASDMVDNFTRTVQIQQNGCGANIAQVTVAVAFADGKCAIGAYCHQQSVQTCLSTVNPVQMP